MSGFEIITFGGGALMQQCLNAVVMVMGASAFESMLLIVALSGVALIGWMLATNQSDLKAAALYLGKIILISNLLITPKATVTIRDQVAASAGMEGAVRVVDNVPMSLGLLAQVTSQIGYGLTQLIENAFSMPESTRYSETGLMFAARLVNHAGYFAVKDGELASNLNHMIQQCVSPELMHGRMVIGDITNTENIWELFKVRANPARFFLFQEGSHRELVSCKDAAVLDKLEQSVCREIHQVPGRLSAALGLPYYGDMKNASRSVILSHLPGAYQFLTGASHANSVDILEQGMMRHALQESYLSKGAELNATAMIDSFMHIKANHENAYHASESAYSAMEWLPWVHTVFTVLLIGLFPIVMLLLFFPGFAGVGKKYLGLFVWLQLWPPITAIVQFCCYYSLQQRGMHLLAANNGHLTLQVLGTLQSASSHAVATAQNFMFAVPAISGFLVFGSSYMMSQALSQSMGGIQSIGAQTAGEAATGNINLGNTQVNTHAMNTTSSHHFDDNLSIMSGSAAIQSASGSMQNYSSDGGFGLQSGVANSQIPQQIHMASSLRNSFDKGLQSSTQVAESAMQTYSEAQSSMYHDLIDLGSHHGFTQNADGTTTVGDTYSDNTAVSKLHELNKQFAQEQHISDHVSANVLAQASANISASKSSPGIGFGGHLETGILGNSISSHDKVYQAGETFVKQHHLNETFDSAKRAVVEDHYRASDDAGVRLTENINANFEKAEHANQQISSSLEQASRYQAGIQYTRDYAETLDRDLTQPFVEWLAEQPDYFSKTPLGVARADSIIHRDPELLKEYVHDFVQTLPENQLLSSMNATIEAEQSGLSAGYQASAASLPTVADVKAAHLDNLDTILTDSRAQHVLTTNVQNNLNDQTDTIKRNVNAQINDSQSLKNETRVEHKAKREIDKHHGHLGQIATREAAKAARSTWDKKAYKKIGDDDEK